MLRRHLHARAVLDVPLRAGARHDRADGRDGLRVFHAFGRVSPARTRVPGLVTLFDVAREWNPHVDMRAWAVNAEVMRTFVGRRWMPTVGDAFCYDGRPGYAVARALRPAVLRGLPADVRLGQQRFLAFYNANVLMHRLRAWRLVTPRNIVDAFYTHLRAPQVNSPLQFGQGARLVEADGVPALAVGVPHPHLSDDLYVQYTRVISPKLAPRASRTAIPGVACAACPVTPPIRGSAASSTPRSGIE